MKKVKKLSPKEIIELDKKLTQLAESLVDREKKIEQAEIAIAQREFELKAREEKLKKIEKYLMEKERELLGGKVNEKKLKKIKTGIPRLDDLMFGGIPFGSNVLVYSPQFTGAEVLLQSFIAQGLKQGVPSVIVTTDKSALDLKRASSLFIPNYKKYEKKNLIKWIDLYSKRSGIEIKDKNIKCIDVNDLDVIGLSIKEVLNELNRREEYYRMVMPLSTLTLTFGASEIFRFLEDICGKCKSDRSVVLYHLIKGMHNENDVQKIKYLMDGVIEFKEENLVTALRIEGICDTQTRSWVQYTFTQKELNMGSFFLDRIKK